MPNSAKSETQAQTLEATTSNMRAALWLVPAQHGPARHGLCHTAAMPEDWVWARGFWISLWLALVSASVQDKKVRNMCRVVRVLQQSCLWLKRAQSSDCLQGLSPLTLLFYECKLHVGHVITVAVYQFRALKLHRLHFL